MQTNENSTLLTGNDLVSYGYRSLIRKLNDGFLSNQQLLL